MAESHSIIITSTTPSGKTASKAITFVDPNASAAKMRALAVGLNGLTQNTISTIERVDRVDIPEHTYELPFPTVAITCGSETWTNAAFTKTQANQTLRIWTGSDGVTKADGKYTAIIRFTNGSRVSLLADSTEQGRLTVGYRVESSNSTAPDGDGVLTLSVPEDFNYQDTESYITVGENSTFSTRNWTIDVYFTDDENDGGLNNG